jgi:CBS-domain-containing membrane protein
MKARDLMSRAAMVHPDDPAEELILAFDGVGPGAVAVAFPDGRLLGLVTHLDLLRALLPPYVREDPALARVLDEDSTWALRERLQGRRVRHVASVRPHRGPVRPEDSLVEVTSALVESERSAIPVVADGIVVGVIVAEDVLPAFLAHCR